MTKEQFLIAMRSLAASVSVISARDAFGETYAMTASSVTSLSIDPPAILVCVNKDASIHDTLVKDVSLCINILQKNQQEISNLCSSTSVLTKSDAIKSYCVFFVSIFLKLLLLNTMPLILSII